MQLADGLLLAAQMPYYHKGEIMKKLSLFIVVMVLALSIFAIHYWSHSFSGTTTDAYVVADSLVTSTIGDNVFIIENTGSGSNDMIYTLYRYYGSWSGVYYVAKLDTLSDDEVSRVSFTDMAYGIKILVKSAVADSITTFSGYINYQK